MKKALTALSLSLVATTPAIAEEKRELGAHEHGVGALNIAIDGTTVAMEFHAPGADIVGFEYEATSEEDLANIDAAISTLSTPQALFVLPSEAGCSLTNASVSLESEENRSDHDYSDHEHEDHKDEDHAEHDHGHDDHKGEDHAEHDHGHDDHKDEDHAEHDHEQDAGHTEFHAEYAMTCDNPDALTSIEFAYFETFANAQEVEVQIVSSSGAQAYEVERDSPTLFLGS